MSVFSPIRLSVTLDNMNLINNTMDDQSYFHDQFRLRRSTAISRWQSDVENLNFQFNTSNQQSLSRGTYLINDSTTNRNIASSSITDVLNSPMSRLSTSSSIMSLSSVGNQKLTNQRVSRPTMTNFSSQLNGFNENTNLFSSTNSFLPVPTRSVNRQTFSAIHNILSNMTDNDLQRVPPSFMLMQPSATYANTPSFTQSQAQVVHSSGRSNSMPSWRGYLPMKFEPLAIDQYQTTIQFSQKVFLGGIPTELTEAELLLVLRKFGKCNIKWPKNDGLNHNMPGFCHVVFRESRSVCELLKHCTRQQRSTIDYFLHIHMSPTSSSSLSTTATSGLPLRTNRLKPIQVVPWNVKDNVFIMQQENMSHVETSYKDWSRTIFVSPLHGKMTAFRLATIMSSVFGSVSMAQINTDKYGYPTGTGTVLFCDSHSYMRGVAAGAIDIKCDCFHKLLDIDPFLRENEPCAFCSSVADLLCRNFHCLRSYCKQCWVNRHGPKPLADHQPATRRQQPLAHI
ncbi:unnamed protein product [Adineta steineri]|uniref:RRM domain-containing protein n=1 Tax=Adineta steineri TaxID=433720 RepID=A0A818V721_9BILA|nr:unnamed protein product [Adineta steineri]CAF1348604.1 unnamed protein product [Adineta steineri]CAF3708380.1 unnamed protein product [Adineta steineri]CAF3972634.1 unnamed protein product [Adineta steineri]